MSNSLRTFAVLIASCTLACGESQRPLPSDEDPVIGAWNEWATRYPAKNDSIVGFVTDQGIDNDAEAAVAARGLTQAGMLRLSDALLKERAAIIAIGLTKLDEESCSKFADGHIPEATITKMQHLLDKPSLRRFVEINAEAALAEVRGSPDPVPVTESELASAWHQLAAQLTPVQLERLQRVKDAAENAGQLDKCLVAQMLMSAAASNSEPGAVLRRAVIAYSM